MQRVDIKQGWLIKQFAQLTFGDEFTDEDVVSCEVDSGLLSVGMATYVLNPTLLMALLEYDELVYQKNLQYKDAWQKDGPITALVDLKDKLYRLESASETGAIVAWDKDKLTGTLFDIFVRTIMCLSWFGLNFRDDDDDRRDKQE